MTRYDCFPLAYDQIHLFDNKPIHCYAWYLIQHKLTKSFYYRAEYYTHVMWALSQMDMNMDMVNLE